MIRFASVKATLLAIVIALPAAAFASPQPPPPLFMNDLARVIIPTPTVASFEAYASAMADDLVVSIDGRRVSTSKADWLAGERKRLGKVDRYVFCFAEGYDAILVIDRFDDRSDITVPDTLFFHSRYKARAVKYSIGPDRLVHAIDVTQTDGIFRTPK